ncbi:MAG TPA: alpha/beta hydrolase-fold protein [bacterium]|nr:alpha/beta hydrolase-fold protein [bacterium]HPR89062.1 alpha/beta hydrolase-fold protein [bacterium]
MRILRTLSLALLLTGWAQLLHPDSPSRVEKYTFYSRILGMTKSCTVYLPPGYDESRQRYPVVYFFRNHEDEWFNTGYAGRDGRALKEVADELIGLGLTGKMILVGPNTGSNDGAMLGLGINYLHPEMAASSVGTGRLEDYLVDEVITQIDSTYRTIADREHRGTDGFSSGGTPAVALALRHPDLFTSVGAFDGDYMWYNLDAPDVPGSGADDPRWLSETYSWYNRMYAPLFGYPRNIPYMLTWGPANILAAADAAQLAQFQQIRFNLETLIVGSAGNDAPNLQLLGRMKEQGLFNTFRDPIVAPEAVHDWVWADLHAFHSLVHHWQTFTHFGWQVAVTPALHFGFQALGESDTLEAEAYNTTPWPVTVTAMTHAKASFQLLDLPSFPFQLDTLYAHFQFRVVFAPTEEGAFKDLIQVESGETGELAARLSLQGTGYQFTPAQDNTLYSATSADTFLKWIELPAGIIHSIAGYGIAAKMNGLSIRPSDKALIGISSGLKKSDFYRICSRNGYAKLLCSVPVGRMLGMAFDAHDSLYAGTADSKLYRITLANGAATLIGSPAGIVFGGLGFHPQTGELYASVRTTGTGKDNIYKVSTRDADTTLVGATGDGNVTTALFFDPAGHLYGLKGSPGQENTIIVIDPATGKGTTLYPLGKSNLVALTLTSLPTLVETTPGRSRPEAWGALLQNYPNPCNAETTVDFTTARPAHTEIGVYNLLGERVAVLQNGLLEGGRHRLVWRGCDAAGRQVPSGIYVIRMTAGGYSESRKMLLLR